jgi:hypothetical protein
MNYSDALHCRWSFFFAGGNCRAGEPGPEAREARRDQHREVATEEAPPTSEAFVEGWRVIECHVL